MFNKKKLRMKAMDKMHNQPDLSMTDLMNHKEKLSKENPGMSEEEKKKRILQRMKESWKDDTTEHGEPLMHMKDDEESGESSSEQSGENESSEPEHMHGMASGDEEGDKGLISVTLSPSEHQMIIEMRKSKGRA